MSKNTPTEDLIEALTLLKPYLKDNYPTGCDHDILRVYVNPEDVPEELYVKLTKLGFDVDDEYSCFSSYTFGSA